MRHATLRYDRKLIRRAVRNFWWRVAGFRYVAALIFLAVSLGVIIARGDTSWVASVLASVLALGVAFPIALYAIHYRNSLLRLDAMGAPSATLDAAETSLSLSSGAGKTTLPWSAIVEVWQFESCWLLLLSKAQFVTLPLADMPPETAEFIIARVLAAGGKVS
ncbi:YcxB family protein [Xanthomonas campestris pv. phormiicola]|nr:YcxB family protein [Xanthomonas campestris pv. phormiicola]UYC16817.1 YcxB family protein [Xanthomonas campestris pv. phormiicola]